MIGRILIGAVRVYQFALSPLLPPACRFYPSCSEYMAEAIQMHGPLRGPWLGLRRLLKCHPWHPGGVDLVPDVPHARMVGKDAHAHAAHLDPTAR